MSNEEAIYALKLIADSLPYWDVDDGSLCKAFTEDLKEALRMAKQALANQGWTSVEDDLPKIREGHESETVLCYTKEGAYVFSCLQENIYGQKMWECEKQDPENIRWSMTVTHWAKLLDPPRGEEDAKNN